MHVASQAKLTNGRLGAVPTRGSLTADDLTVLEVPMVTHPHYTSTLWAATKDKIGPTTKNTYKSLPRDELPDELLAPPFPGTAGAKQPWRDIVEHVVALYNSGELPDGVITTGGRFPAVENAKLCIAAEAYVPNLKTILGDSRSPLPPPAPFSLFARRAAQCPCHMLVACTTCKPTAGPLCECVLLIISGSDVVESVICAWRDLHEDAEPSDEESPRDGSAPAPATADDLLDVGVSEVQETAGAAAVVRSLSEAADLLHLGAQADGQEEDGEQISLSPGSSLNLSSSEASAKGCSDGDGEAVEEDSGEEEGEQDESDPSVQEDGNIQEDGRERS